jgi:hypothetical protein
MKSDLLIAQIEIYSNAIVGFTVLQAIAFAYSFGSNQFFNCLVKTSRYLPHGLVVHFSIRDDPCLLRRDGTWKTGAQLIE